MKPNSHSRIAAFIPIMRSYFVVCMTVCASSSAFAASQTWDGDTDAFWSTSANWVGNAVPGIIYTANNTNTTDVATFNAAINGVTLAGSSANPVTFATNRMIGRIVFDSANASSYFIGEAVASPTLTFGNNLTILDALSTVVYPQTINAPVAIHLPSSTNGGATIQNSATSSAATLTLAGGIVNSPNSTRGTAWTIGGINTGANTISGLITLTSSGGIASTLTKAGVGQWILTGSNTIGGGVTVNDGTLVAQDPSAFGAAGLTINGGLVRLDADITLASSNVTMNAGEIRSNGSSVLNMLTVGATATSPLISTVSALDVFTIGGGTNTFTGGTASTVIRTGGPGMVVLAGANNYVGIVSVDAGSVKLGSASSLGTGGVAFGPGSTGKLILDGWSATIGSLTTDVSVGTAVIENSYAADTTLTVSNSSGASTYGGILRNGVGGNPLSLAKAGASTLTLAGASNSYTGGTTVTGGTLLVTNSSGSSATGTGPVAINSGTLGGNGFISGAVTVAGTLAPGVGGIGTLTTGPLTLSGGSQLNFDITSAASLDLINVSGALSISDAQLNINGGTTAFTTNGTYKLIGGFTGTPSIAGLSVNGLNKTITKNYNFAVESGFVVLKVTDSAAVISYWNADASGNWSPGTWTTSTPNAIGASAFFGGGGTPITAARTITVNGAFTIGTLGFNNATQNFTLASGGGANLKLNNGASTALVTDLAGSHLVQAPLTLSSSGTTVSILNSGDALTFSGSVSGGGMMSKIGSGTLALTGANDYTGDTSINAGTVVINSVNSLGVSTALATINAASLKVIDNITTTRNFLITDATSAISVDATKTFAITGMIGAGSGKLNKFGTGTLVLSGINGYTGGTVINAGTISINSADSLGSTSGPLTINDGTLVTTADINNLRNISLGNSTSAIQTDPATTYVVAGAISGPGALNKISTGTLVLGAGSSYSGGTAIKGGILSVGNNGGVATLGSGTVTFENGSTLTNSYNANNSWFIDKPLFVGPGQTGNFNLGNRIVVASLVSGSGTLNVNAQSITDRNDLTGSWNTFAGQINFAGTSNIRLLTQGGTFNGFDAASVTMEGSVSFAGRNFSGGATTNFGMLTGTSTTTALLGSSLGGQNTWSIGALGSSGTFAGQILGGNLVKVGGGTLTLTGTNSYTGTTAVNGGTLRISGDNSLAVGTVTVADSATLGGNGNLGGDVIIGANGHQALTVAATPATQVTRTIGGVLDLTAALDVLDLTAATTPASGTYTLITATGGITGQTGGVLDDTAVNLTGLSGTVSVVGNDLVLTVTGGGSAYATWASSKGLTGANNGPTQDPEFDGIPNSLEFVLSGNPLASDTSILPILTTTSTNFIFTFTRADESEAEVGLTFEYGTTLANPWTSVAIGVDTAFSGPGVAVTENGAAPDTIQITIAKGTNTKLFGRLKAVK